MPRSGEVSKIVKNIVLENRHASVRQMAELDVSQKSVGLIIWTTCFYSIDPDKLFFSRTRLNLLLDVVDPTYMDRKVMRHVSMSFETKTS